MRTLESIFRRRHVSVVFSGHEHIYQRSTLQNGIQYFISGGAGQSFQRLLAAYLRTTSTQLSQ